MADNNTYYRERLYQVYEVPAPDDLVDGWTNQDEIVIAASGILKRGTLLMSGTGGFVPATEAGIAAADEICILCANLEIPEGETALSGGYFGGTFNASRIILAWEDESSNHIADMESLRETLRRHKIFIKNNTDGRA